MKLILNRFVVFLFFVCSPVFGDDIFKTYTIKVAGIKIGKLDWEIKINDNNYTNKIKIKSEGFLSALYRFEGDYFSEGSLKDKTLKPKKYSHTWKTTKTTKKMFLFFDNNKLKLLEQEPVESEYLRINVYNIKKTKDPLTSFLQIIMGANSSLVLDGRRLYKMNAVYKKDIKKTIIELNNFSNLWADHKRSKFEKISFENDNAALLPSKIFIYFDGKVFRLE